ncbi:MAG: hypothetical protein IKM08_08585 [Clostridia bacterium]|nr:hypothetical protein [Clostridia bacterium]
MPEKQERKKKKSAVRRLLIANLVAALGLLTITVTVLFCLGLLDTVFAFIF